MIIAKVLISYFQYIDIQLEANTTVMGYLVPISEVETFFEILFIYSNQLVDILFHSV